MATVRRTADRRARQQAEYLAREVLAARAQLGRSQREVARRGGVSPASVRRVESGDPHVQFDTQCAVASAVGLDAVLRLYPSRPVSLRDSGQLGIAQMLVEVVHPAWQPKLEVPAGDHGEAVDIGLFGSTEILAVEIDRLLVSFEETYRRNQRKRDHLAARHQRPVRLVMVVQDTPRNRESVEPHMELVRHALPAGSREVLAALRSGSPLSRDGLLWIRPSRPPRAAANR